MDLDGVAPSVVLVDGELGWDLKEGRVKENLLQVFLERCLRAKDWREVEVTAKHCGRVQKAVPRLLNQSRTTPKAYS